MKKNILAVIVLLTLTLTPLMGIQQARADSFLTCVAKGGNVAKCYEESQASASKTSFTEFKGGLAAPSTEGYSTKLTQATDVRTYALNVSNFALGFLALLAVLIIIYGGFMYVTAAGKEEQATKGKKAVSYAVIGMLIIMGSFAIVNTVLQAPGGKETTGGAAPETTGSGTSPQGSFNSLDDRVNVLARDIVTAFQYHFDAQADMAVVLTDIKCATTLPLVSGCTTLALFEKSINDANDKITNMKSRISNTVDSMLITDAIENLSASLTMYKTQVATAVSNPALATPCTTILPPVGGGGLDVKEVGIKMVDNACLDREIQKAISAVPTTDVIAAHTAALTAVKGNFNSAVISTKSALKEMYSAVGPVTAIADIQFGNLVDIGFLKQEAALTTKEMTGEADGTLKKLDTLVTKATEQSETENTALSDVLLQFSALYSVLKDLKFVDARITASVTEGNAPLVVNFSSVGSIDPSGLTIQENSQIQWDLNGDGKWNTSTSNYTDCWEKPKATITCTYLMPGTYRVRLYVSANSTLDPNSANPQKKYSEEIGPGISTITIKVNPPQTRINLSIDNALQDTGKYYLMQYDENGFLVVNRSSVSVLASKAKSEGVQFNAILTKAKGGDLLSTQAAQGATIKWDFGDGSRDQYNNAILEAIDGNLSPPPHIYEKEGTYTVTAEFTDKSGIVDRKIFTVVVSSLAPLMEINPVAARIGDEVVFDGSNSASDNGPMDYAWTVTPNDLTGLDPDALNTDSFKYKFTKAGNYTVNLAVTDPIITTASPLTETLPVTSKPPVSQFTFEIPKTSQPGTVTLDGSKSYDPDGAGPFTYQWEINGQKSPSTADYAFVDSTTPTSAKANVKFKKAGTYAVTLVATDSKEPTSVSEPLEKEITVDSILDIAWGTSDVVSSVVKLSADGKTENTPQISMTINSETAVAYEVDYGDGEKENGDMAKTATLKHTYAKAGTYVVKATVYDAEDKGNSLSRKVYIGSSIPPAIPVAVIGIALNGETVIPEQGVPLEISRKDVVGFDASASKNTDGTGRRLSYSWDLGDGEKSTKDKLTHTYSDTGTYKVSLKVINTDDVSQSAPDTFDITVKPEPPTLKSLTAVPTGSSLTTPVTVKLDAIGAVDPDGKITKYRWWYYDSTNDQDPLGVQVSTSPTATVTIGTIGDEGAPKTYKFAVEITDDENATVSSRDIIDEKYAPELEVTNGPNKAPVAKFNVDRTDIMVGDVVNFASSSTDPDGQITDYFWDFEGKGFSENLGPNPPHTYSSPAPNGFRVRLKVRDNNESESISDPVVIYVEGKAKPPTAAFTSAQDGTTKKVKFTNTSTADTANGANIDSYAWDFDTAKDFNGDGKNDNDIESTEKDPTHEYKDYGIYRAKLVVTDSEKTKGEITNFVNVKAAAAPVPVKPTPTPTPTPKPTPTPTPATILDARLLTTPAPSFVDGKIHLAGDNKDVTFDFSTSAGNIKKYVIDKNTNFDTNKNGIKDDDEDYTATAPGKWTTNFSRSFGNVKVRLTVIDGTGKKDTVEKEVVFDQAAGSVFTANVFGPENYGIAAFLVAAAGFAIMAIKRSTSSINKQK